MTGRISALFSSHRWGFGRCQMRGPQHELNILAFQAVMQPKKGSSRGKSKGAPCSVCSSPDHRVESCCHPAAAQMRGWPGKSVKVRDSLRLFGGYTRLHQAIAAREKGVATWEMSVAKEEERDCLPCTPAEICGPAKRCVG